MMSNRLSNHYFLSVFSLVVCMIMISCNKDEDFSIGNKLLDSQTNVSLIDTFTVALSTVVLDSFPTYGQNIIVLGYTSDTNIGKISCSSYFELGIPSSITINEDDFLDSVTLKLTYSGYSYGDTTIPFIFSIHRLTEIPEDSTMLYNTTSLGYTKDPLVTTTIFPTPTQDQTIEIRLPDTLGKEYMKKIYDGDNEFSSNDDFLEYFNGLALIPDSITNRAIINFKASEANLSMVLYIHRYSETSDQVTYEFPLLNPGNQFNRIIHNFNGTGLKNFTDQRYAISSTLTGNRSFLIGGAGLFVKAEFPYLQELNYFKKGAILKSELIFYPDEISALDNSIPSEVILYESNQYNKFGSTILSEDGKSTQIGTQILDEYYHEDISYTFNITSYLLSEFSDGYFDANNSLILCLSTEKFSTTFSRLNVKSGKYAPKLKIYYVTY